MSFVVWVVVGVSGPVPGALIKFGFQRSELERCVGICCAHCLFDCCVLGAHHGCVDFCYAWLEDLALKRLNGGLCCCVELAHGGRRGLDGRH